jgi:hypothetical protein
MRNWLLILAAAAIGCSSGGETTSTGTQRPTTSTGSGGSGGGTGGTSGGSGGSGGATGGSGGSGGGTGGSGGATGGSGGTTGGASGAAGKGGAAGSTGGTGGSGGGVDGGGGARDASMDMATGGAAGSGGSGGGAMDASMPRDASMDEMQACTSFADAFCDRLQTCSSFVVSVLYGDVATCKSRWMMSCLPNFGIAGTSASPMRTSTCAQQIPSLACDKFINGDFAAATACLPAAGMVPLGGGCGDDAQCTTTFCARSATSACGTCQPTTPAGTPCVQGSCSVATNTVCPAGGSTCVKPKSGKVGDACTAQEECDVANQVGCNTVTSKTCIALTLSTGTCGANNPLNPTMVAVCGKGGTCTGPFAGMCTPVAQDGQTCSTTDTGAHCMFPAKCIGGRCVVPDPSTCK